jgi:hypothetical protein
MSDLIKTYNFGRPPAGTDVHASKGPATTPTFSHPRAAEFFFRGNAVETRGGGALLRKGGSAKLRSANLRDLAGTKRQNRKGGI